MSATLPSRCVPDDVEQPSNGRLFLQGHTDGDARVVRVVGELDAASRDRLVLASTAGDHPAIVIDLAGVTFMDCSGLGSIEASRAIVERGGRTLVIRGQTGQPARLLELIAALESRSYTHG